MINAQEVKFRLHGQIEAVLHHLLPEGKARGKEYLVGNIQGKPGDSMGIVIQGEKVGLWKDFATGEAGDIFDLWMGVKGITFKEAFEQACDFLGIVNLEPVKKKERPPPPSLTQVRPIRDTAVAEYFAGRGINLETLALYQVRSFERQGPSGNHHAAFRFWDSAGEFVMIKTKGIHPGPGGKKDIWSTPPYYTLWGWHLVDDRCREIAITEGEEDAMSLYQMSGGKMPVLSLPSGGSNFTWIDNDFDRLQRFEKIYYCGDADDAGKAAGQEISNRLGISRVWHIPLPKGFKDANEVLARGDSEKQDAANWYQKAKTFTPKTIQGARDQLEDVRAMFRRAAGGESSTFMWPEMPFDFREGETTVLSGYPGSGKSTLLNQTALHYMQRGEKFLACSYEIRPAAMIMQLVMMMHGSKPTDAQIEEGVNWLEDRLWFLVPEKPAILDNLWRDLRYARARFGVHKAAIDSLHFLAKKDDYNLQDYIADTLQELDLETGLHTIVVCHAKVKDLGIDKVPEMGQVEGSGGVAKGPDNGISMWRNTRKRAAIEKAEEENDQAKMEKALAMPDATICFWKQRWGSGKLFSKPLWFDEETRRFRSTRKALPIPGTPTNDQEQLPF